MTSQTFLKNLAIAFLAFFLFLGILTNALFLANRGRIIYGTTLAELNIGGLKKEVAMSQLEEALNRWQAEPITIILENKQIKTSWPALGFEFDISKTLERAMYLGRDNHIFGDFFQQAKTLIRGTKLLPIINWNQANFATFNNLHFSSLIAPSQNASLKYEAGEIFLIESRSGREPDWRSFKNFVQKKAQNLEPIKSFELKLKAVFPEIRDEETEQAMIKALEILGEAPYKIKLEDKSWEIKKEDLGRWLSFEPVFERGSENQILGVSLKEEAINNFLLSIAPQVNRFPQNARLGFEEGKVIIKEKSQNGIVVLLEDSVEKISRDILAGIKTLDLVVEETQAEVGVATLDNLGLETLLGEGRSDFTGSSLSRVNNIKVGSAKFDKYLIKPEQEFSFNEILGEISGKEGYLPGLVIKDNQLIPEYGGGICQVSTTMFRAAVYAGFEITERYPHSFPVSYYNPQGFDATIYPPHPDLRFINNTSGHAYIQRRIEGNQLVFEVYGKDEGREVVVKGPYVYERDKVADTMKTVLWQEVYDKDGKQIFKKGFWSFYQSPSLYPIASEEKPAEDETSDNNGLIEED